MPLTERERSIKDQICNQAENKAPQGAARDFLGSEDAPEENGLRSVLETGRPPSWLINPNTGKLRNFLAKHELPTDEGQCHFLCQEGIGDVAWVWAKFWKLAEERDCTFWFPDNTRDAVVNSRHRIGPYADLVGMKYGFCQIDVREMLEYPGEFQEGDFDEGGVFYVHSAVHLGKGKRIEDWHPWLPFKNPAPEVFNGPNMQDTSRVWRWRGCDPYIVIHMGCPLYMEGNYFPAFWAKMIKKIEEKVAPVMLMGAKWDEQMIEEVSHFYKPSLDPCIGQPLSRALSFIVNSRGMIGIDSGLTILATYMGMPALRCYPRRLDLLRHSWYDPATLHEHNRAIFMDELYDELEGWLEAIAVG